MIAVLTSFVVIFLMICIKYCFAKKQMKPPLAKKALPIIGHAWMAFEKRERLYDTIFNTILKPSFERHEDLVYISVGTWKIYVCMDPEDGLLLTNCLTKDPLYKYLTPLFGGENGLIIADEPTWKVHRKLLNPTMNQSVLDTYLTEFNDHSRQLIRLMAEHLDNGPFDPLPYLKQIILQTVCATIMGVRMENDKALIKAFGEASDIICSCTTERSLKICYHSDYIFNLSNLKKRQDAAAANARNVTYEVIRRAKEKLSSHKQKENGLDRRRFKSLLDRLLDIGRDGYLTDSEIQQEVATFMAAGFDTTYHTIGTTLLTIGSYPRVQQKLVEELQQIFKGSPREADKKDLSKMQFLEAVIKETMRLYPVVVAIGRKLDKDVKLKHYTLPAGSRCFVSIYHVGRHRVWGEDADQFRPERWLDGSLPTHAGASAGFGLGKRSCIGSNFAMMMMKTVLSHVLRAYRISGDITHLVQIFDIAIAPASGHHISLTRRDNARVMT